MDILPVLRKNSLIVVSSHTTAKEEIAALSAELALRGSVTVLDGGNCFPFYRFARLIRSQSYEGAAAVKRLFIRRAFTRYQMLELLSSTPALDQPYLILNLLATFYDEQIPEREVRRLLDACLMEVNRLSMRAPVMISLLPPRLLERAFLAEQICQTADQFFILDEPAPEFIQPALF